MFWRDLSSLFFSFFNSRNKNMNRGSLVMANPTLYFRFLLSALNGVGWVRALAEFRRAEK
jgi:hypothetical protein